MITRREQARKAKFHRVIAGAGDDGELHSAILVGGGRYYREAGETEADFEARIMALHP